MKITDITYDKLRVKLPKPFVVAIGTIEYAESIIVKVSTDEGITGYGEAAPFAPVTGETLDTIVVFLEQFKKVLAGENPFEIEKIHKKMNRLTVGNTSAKASIDIAMYDIMGKKLGMPLYKLLGGFGNSFETDMTIGIGTPEDMVNTAKKYLNDGYKILKVKAGIDPDEDIFNLAQIRAAAGNQMRIRVDANQGWRVNTTLRVLEEYEKHGVEAVEQPVPYWDIDGLAYIRKHSKIAIMADESLHSPHDAMKLAKIEAADIFNIKLMKSAGLYPALQINAIGEAAGISCILGCMLESRLSNAAAAALVAAQSNILDADLDSFRHFDDNVISGGFVVENGVVTMLEKPGLGVDVNL